MRVKWSRRTLTTVSAYYRCRSLRAECTILRFHIRFHIRGFNHTGDLGCLKGSLFPRIYFDVVRPDTECQFSLFRLILDFAPHAFEHIRNLETDVKTRSVALCFK